MTVRLRIHGVVRYLCPDRNPLRRRIDRLRSALIAAVMVAFALGGPLAAKVVGRVAYDSGVQAQRAQRMARHRVTATVESVTEAIAPGTYMSMSTLTWRTPAGVTRTETTMKARGDRVGRRRQVWIDRSGALTGPPRTHVQTIATAVPASAGGITAVGMALYGSYAAIRRRLDRTGAALWDAEWREVAPHWTGRT